MKYIDAERLKAEIERRIAQWQPYTFACASLIASEAFDRIDELKGLLIYITSLQQEQPEVDFEKAYKSYIESRKDDLSGNAVTVNMKDLARHFYSLGLNARKEE